MLLERLGRRGGLRWLPYKLVSWRLQHRLGQGVQYQWRMPGTSGAGALGANARPTHASPT